MSGISVGELEDPRFPCFVTFYSFKGGVGRSLALINSALVLARSGRSVLVIDLDLEAPGIQRVEPFTSVGPEEQGFLELMERLLSQLPLQNGGTWISPDENPPSEPVCLSDYYYEVPDSTNPEGESKPETRLKEETSKPVDSRSPEGGRLCLMPPGRRMNRYPERVEALRIGELYQEGIGRAFFRNLRSAFGQEPFEYILVDSRTGWSDIGGMCTRDLADAVVVVSGLNDQNLDGTREVMASIKQRRQEGPVPQLILVASPVPLAEEDLKKQRLKIFKEKIGAPPAVQLPYHPRLALQDLPFVGRYEGELTNGYVELTRQILLFAGDDAESWIKRGVNCLKEQDRETYLHAFSRAYGVEQVRTRSVLVSMAEAVPVEEERLGERETLHDSIMRLMPAAAGELSAFGYYLDQLGERTKRKELRERGFDRLMVALDIEPTFPRALRYGFGILSELGSPPLMVARFETALANFDKSLDTRPEDKNVRFARGIANLLRGLLEGRASSLFAAAAIFEQSAGEAPGNFDALFYGGLALTELAKLTNETEQWTQAGLKFQQALELRPNHAASLQFLGDALLVQGARASDADLVRTALQKFEAASRIDPTNAASLAGWGYALAKLGQLGGERRHFEEALGKLNAAETLEIGSAAFQLACFYAMTEEKDKAIEWLTRAAQHDARALQYARSEDDFIALRDHPDFQALLDKGPPASDTK